MFEKPPEAPRQETVAKLSPEEEKRLANEAVALNWKLYKEGMDKLDPLMKSAGPDAYALAMNAFQAATGAWLDHYCKELGISDEAIDQAVKDS